VHKISGHHSHFPEIDAQIIFWGLEQKAPSGKVGFFWFQRIFLEFCGQATGFGVFKQNRFHHFCCLAVEVQGVIEILLLQVVGLVVVDWVRVWAGILAFVELHEIILNGFVELPLS
jgi:hypothetical protein